MKFTPEDLEKLQTRQLANVVRKLNDGKTISAREQQMLDDARAVDNRQSDASAARTSDTGLNFVRNWDDLAQALEVSRKSVQNWRSREDLRGAQDFPRPRPDGRHDVAAWRRFMLAHGLNRAGDAVPGDELNGEGVLPKTHWDRLRAQIGFEREAFAFEADKLKHIEVAQISAAVGQMLAGFRTALNNLPASAARWVIGLRDFHQVKDKLQSEVDAVLQSLGRCEYLENLIPEVVAKLYPDRDEQFRGNLIECADGVLREFGRMALSDLLQRSLPQHSESPAAAIPDANTAVADSGEGSLAPVEKTAAKPSPKSRAKKLPRK